MTTGDPARLHAEFEAVWGNPRGWRALTIVNHSSIGLRFIVTGAAFFLFAGLLAMLMRSQLAVPRHDFMSADAYNQAFTAHGTMMMFLFAVPMLEGLAAYLIPKMIGARDLVFPRLSAFGYWCYLFGGLIFAAGVLLGVAPDAGWFMYTPLSSRPYSPGPGSDFWLIGVTFVEISAVAAAVELAVSILRTRAAGMTLERMPIFCWYILVTSLMIIVAFPPLILGSILLELERAAGWAFFDVARGGDPLLWQHLFWLFGHPEVYIIFLPAAGIVSTVLPVFARRPLVGYRWTVFAVIVTGFVSFALWVHHMYMVGMSHMAQAFFSAASMFVAVPTGIQLFAWIATLWTGAPVAAIPMLWIFGFLVIFVLGGLTGVMLALVPFDVQVHDTHFVVAHMHYVLVGGMLFPLIAGLYHWLPLFSGRLPSQRLARAGFWLTFVGFNGTFLVMHWTGLLGMPRRVYTYEPGLGWEWPNLISSVFGFVMAFGIAAVLFDVALHWWHGRRAAAHNPWRADTLEWAMPLPPPAYNFASLPAVQTRHPLWESPELPETIAAGRHALATAKHGRRETLGTDPVSARAREVIHLPGNSWLPLLAGLALAALCVALIAARYAVALAFAAAALAVLLRWSWENGVREETAGHAGSGTPQRPGGLPLHGHTDDGPGIWGMGFTLLADAALVASLLFGWVFLWSVAPQFAAPASSPLAKGPAAFALPASGVLLTLGMLWLEQLRRALRQRRDGGLFAGLLGVAGLGALAAAGLGWTLARAPLAPSTNAHDALMTFIVLYVALHVALAALLAALQAWRVRRGYVGAHSPYEPAVVSQLWRFAAVAFWLAYAALTLVPQAFGAAS